MTGQSSAQPGPELVELTGRDRDRILALADSAEIVDGVAPLSEEHLLAMRQPGATALLVRRGGRLVGVASRSGDAAEVVVNPEYRHSGYGAALVSATLELAPGVGFWAHGDLRAARATARRTGLRAGRQLLHLVRARETTLIPQAPLALRSYADALAEGTAQEFLDAWLALNARAFASHPEQGRWTMADVRERVAADWFDPTMLWLLPAENGTSALTAAGSIWIKPQGEEAEIYVLAVDPGFAGRGLGRALLAHGLAEVEARGVVVVDLYVDGGNGAARRLYQRFGFLVEKRDVQYVPVAKVTLGGATIGA